MKKVKLKLKWDELNAIHQYIQANVLGWPEGLPNGYVWQWRLVQSVIAMWDSKLQQKLYFRKPKPFVFSMDVASACAFMLFFGWNKADINPADYLGNLVIRIQNEIQQQLA